MQEVSGSIPLGSTKIFLGLSIANRGREGALWAFNFRAFRQIRRELLYAAGIMEWAYTGPSRGDVELIRPAIARWRPASPR